MLSVFCLLPTMYVLQKMRLHRFIPAIVLARHVKHALARRAVKPLHHQVVSNWYKMVLLVM